MIDTDEVDELMKDAFTPAGAPPAQSSGAPMPPGPGMMPMDPSMMAAGQAGGPMGAPLPPDMGMPMQAPPAPEGGMQIPPGMALVPVEALQAMTGGGEKAEEPDQEAPAEEGSGREEELSDRLEIIETQMAELMNMLPQLLGMTAPPGGMAPGGAQASPEGLPIQGVPPEMAGAEGAEGMAEAEPPFVPQLPTEGITPEERSTMSLIKSLRG